VRFDTVYHAYFAGMYEMMNWALVIPMANEEKEFEPFIEELKQMLDKIKSGKIYLIVDDISKDKTRELCEQLSQHDERFITVWAPENKNVVDAYMRGYKTALENNHDFIIEMDAGLSHSPSLLPEFLKKYSEGYECVFGSRFIAGGTMEHASVKRKLLSKGGTAVSNLLLESKLYDMTSGFQGFSRKVVERFLSYPLKSKAHFYQTELRYLLRRYNYVEIPISYKAPSPSVSKNAIINSMTTLLYYFWRRVSFRSVSL
jgi:dolichol-phosphate mannosyltransferase